MKAFLCVLLTLKLVKVIDGSFEDLSGTSKKRSIRDVEVDAVDGSGDDATPLDLTHIDEEPDEFTKVESGSGFLTEPKNPESGSSPLLPKFSSDNNLEKDSTTVAPFLFEKSTEEVNQLESRMSPIDTTNISSEGIDAKSVALDKVSSIQDLFPDRTENADRIDSYSSSTPKSTKVNSHHVPPVQEETKIHGASHVPGQEIHLNQKSSITNNLYGSGNLFPEEMYIENDALPMDNLNDDNIDSKNTKVNVLSSGESYSKNTTIYGDREWGLFPSDDLSLIIFILLCLILIVILSICCFIIGQLTSYIVVQFVPEPERKSNTYINVCPVATDQSEMVAQFSNVKEDNSSVQLLSVSSLTSKDPQNKIHPSNVTVSEMKSSKKFTLNHQGVESRPTSNFSKDTWFNEILSEIEGEDAKPVDKFNVQSNVRIQSNQNTHNETKMEASLEKFNQTNLCIENRYLNDQILKNDESIVQVDTSLSKSMDELSLDDDLNGYLDNSFPV